jgi:hypothetical protein
MQIASSNLKMLQAEKARPTQVVVDPEKAGETPLGMTPWSASGEGHDLEEEPSSPGAAASRAETAPATPATPATQTAEEFYAAMSVEERNALRKEYEERNVIPHRALEAFKLRGGPDPLPDAIYAVWKERDRRKALKSARAAGG